MIEFGFRGEGRSHSKIPKFTLFTERCCFWLYTIDVHLNCMTNLSLPTNNMECTGWRVHNVYYGERSFGFCFFLRVFCFFSSTYSWIWHIRISPYLHPMNMFISQSLKKKMDRCTLKHYLESLGIYESVFLFLKNNNNSRKSLVPHQNHPLAIFFNG